MKVSLPATWFVGCGNMAGALIAGWQKADVDLAEAIAIRPSGRPVDGVTTVSALPEGPPPLRCVLGFKPQTLAEVAPALAPRLSADTVLVSMLAGVDAATLRALFPNVAAIVRVMPNLAVSERAGVTALYSEDADPALRARIGGLFELLGLAPWCESEAAFSAIGAVAGSGPAYVARFVDALAAGGEGLGLSPELAAGIARQTLLGTAAMAGTGESMADIACRVASPKGTTEQGLAVLDDPAAGLLPLVRRMLEAAIVRGRQLADEAARRS